MAVRTATAAAVITAAVVVYALVQLRRNRQLRRLLARERASHHLMAGCMARDITEFRLRLNQATAQERVAAAASRVLDEALAHHYPMTPPTEGGTP